MLLVSCSLKSGDEGNSKKNTYEWQRALVTVRNMEEETGRELTSITR